MKPWTMSLLVLLLACPGRDVPHSDTGVPGDAAVILDGGSPRDTGPAPDAGGCVERDPLCEEGRAPSEVAPCMPWEQDCHRRQRCSDEAVVWCRPMNGCLAVPVCDATNPVPSDPPCGLDETRCSIHSMCGRTLFCRPDGDCQPVSCRQGERASSVPCGFDEPDCQSVYACDQAIWCRVDPLCDAMPSCSRGVETLYPCTRGEAYCERVTVCGHTRFCRY